MPGGAPATGPGRRGMGSVAFFFGCLPEDGSRLLTVRNATRAVGVSPCSQLVHL